MTQTGSPGQAPTDPNASVPATATGQSADQGTGAQGGAPASGEQSGSTVPLAVYTNSRQLISGLARELGISKDASQDQFLEAIRTRSQAAVAPDDDTDDPVILRERKRLHERAWELAGEKYGEPIVEQARSFYDAVASNRDPYAMVAAFAAAVTDAAVALAGAGPAQAGSTQPGQQPPAAPQQQQTPGTPDLGSLSQGAGQSGQIDPRQYRGDTEGWFRARLAQMRGQSR